MTDSDRVSMRQAIVTLVLAWAAAVAIIIGVVVGFRMLLRLWH